MAQKQQSSASGALLGEYNSHYLQGRHLADVGENGGNQFLMAVRHALLSYRVLRLGLMFLGFTFAVKAQEHHHPPQDVQLHEKFYSTWYMPDNPSKSCCNKQDCYPTEIKYVGTSLFARRREDGAWIIVPPQKIERNRDNPDGRNHVCMPPPNHSQAGSVFCFSLGGGI
jgi:hypothetical protein